MAFSLFPYLSLSNHPRILSVLPPTISQVHPLLYIWISTALVHSLISHSDYCVYFIYSPCPLCLPDCSHAKPHHASPSLEYFSISMCSTELSLWFLVPLTRSFILGSYSPLQSYLGSLLPYSNDIVWLYKLLPLPDMTLSLLFVQLKPFDFTRVELPLRNGIIFPLGFP